MALEKDDRVRVMNTTYGGEIFVEGIATIIEPTVGMDRYMVRFDGDAPGETYARFCEERNKVEEDQEMIHCPNPDHEDKNPSAVRSSDGSVRCLACGWKQESD